MKHMGKHAFPTYLFFSVAIAVLASAGCLRKPPSKTKEQVMQEKLQERLDRWHADMENSCTRRVMERAAIIVDSTLLADARFKRDTSDLPPVPGRPEKPAFTPPRDSVPIRPIFGPLSDSLH